MPWKLDKETCVFSSRAQFSIVTLLFLENALRHSRGPCVSVWVDMQVFLRPLSLTHWISLLLNPHGFTQTVGAGWRKLSSSSFRQAVCSARCFKINYSQIWVYVRAREWKKLQNWVKDCICFLNGETEVNARAQGFIWYLCQQGASWWQKHRKWSK